MKKAVLWGALLWAWACGDTEPQIGTRPDAGSQPDRASSGARWREPERPFPSDSGAAVSTCNSSNGACRLDGAPPPRGLGSPEPIEPDRPSGPAPDPSPIEAPAPAAAGR